MENKVVLISGGSSGIGLATAKAFREKGATVIVASRSLDTFEKNLGKPAPQMRFIATDFSDMESVKNLYLKVAEEFETIDFAVNNVGAATIKPLIEYEEDEYDYLFNVNLKSLWLSMKHQIPLMVKDERQSKHIINISSINGLGGAEYISLYAAAKAGVTSLTKSAALEMARSNISINAIVPGPFETPMLKSTLKFQAGGDEDKFTAMEEQYKQIIPKGRFGEPEEIAQTILWLCEGNNKFMSGHSLIIDGGLSSRFR